MGDSGVCFGVTDIKHKPRRGMGLTDSSGDGRDESSIEPLGIVIVKEPVRFSNLAAPLRPMFWRHRRAVAGCIESDLAPGRTGVPTYHRRTHPKSRLENLPVFCARSLGSIVTSPFLDASLCHLALRQLA